MHWRKGVTIGELFTADVAAGLALPGLGFDAVRYETRSADKFGNIVIEHVTYGAGPAYRSATVTVGLRHDSVQILDEGNHPVVTFPRSYDHQAGTVIDPAGLLALLARKPGAWRQSLIRPLLPDPVADYLDAATPADRRRLFTALDDTVGTAGFDAATDAASQLIRRGDAPETATIGMLARRITQGNHHTAPEVNLNIYDGLVGKGQSA